MKTRVKKLETKKIFFLRKKEKVSRSQPDGTTYVYFQVGQK
jgi:hypothetical protein